MAEDHEDSCNSPLKIGLIFVKSKGTEGMCLSRDSSSDAFPCTSCEWHDKWIIIAGNNYNMESPIEGTLEHPAKQLTLPLRNRKVLFCLNDCDKKESAKKLVKNNQIHSPMEYHILEETLLQMNITEMHLDSVFKASVIFSKEEFSVIEFQYQQRMISCHYLLKTVNTQDQMNCFVQNPEKEISRLIMEYTDSTSTQNKSYIIFCLNTTQYSTEPIKLFKCVNVRVLSLRHNNMMFLPAEIGRLSQLKTLILTDNCLTFSSIPFTLTFCNNLTELYLDHNLLDALPGFLLDMPQLETVYRHGNHNYFKSTFMWYHTAERDRVMPLRPNRTNAKIEGIMYQPLSLESQSIKSLISTKINFFTPGLLPATLQDYIAKIYPRHNMCGYCSQAFHGSKTGFRVFTFKNPYLGNTCVPFEHWTCSRECGVALEEPAHKEERAQARQLDKQYQKYILSIENQFRQKQPDKGLGPCVVM